MSDIWRKVRVLACLHAGQLASSALCATHEFYDISASVVDQSAIKVPLSTMQVDQCQAEKAAGSRLRD